MLAPLNTRISLLLVVLLSVNESLLAQKYEISLNGSLPSGWINNSSNPQKLSMDLVNIINDGLDDKQDEQTYKSQQFINFLHFGGITLTAANSTLKEFISLYVAEKENDKYIEYYKKNFKGHEEYIAENYGDKVPTGLEKMKFLTYPAYLFYTHGMKEEKEEGLYNYFILINEEKKAGVSVTVRISHIPEKRSYTFDGYQRSAESVLGLLSFREIEDAGNVKKEIKITAELKAGQSLSPPARAAEALSDLSLKKWFQRGAAVSQLKLIVSLEDPAALPYVTVSFTIDPPSKITGPGKRVRPDENKEAITTFEFNRSEATSQAGIIYARASFPESILLLSDGTYKESAKRKQLTIPINPVCDEYNLEGKYYKDNLISDIAYPEFQLQNQMLTAIKDYKDQSGSNVSTTWFWRSGLLFYLANHGGAALGIKWQYQTGNEVALTRHIMNSSSKITPGEVFKKALELNKGDVNKALLACHNVIRSAARGNEDYSSQLTDEEKKLLSASSYKNLSKEDQSKKMELNYLSGRTDNSTFFNSLAPLRAGDNKGAWYHFFATSLVSFNNKSYTGLVGNGMKAPLEGYRSALDLMIWTEENLVSRDIYSDPNEYCIDHFGLKTGDLIAEKYFPEFQALNNPDLLQQYLEKRKSSDEAASAPIAIGVYSPISIKVTDKKSGQFFSYDQLTGNYTGNLAAIPSFQPESSSRYFQYILLLPNSSYEIVCDAIDSGSFSFYTFNFSNNRGAKYEHIPISKGDRFSTSVSPANTTNALLSSTGMAYDAIIEEYTPENVASIRAASIKEAIEETKSLSNQESSTDPGSYTTETTIDKNTFFNLFVLAGIAVTLLSIIVYLFTRKKWVALLIVAGIGLIFYGYFYFKRSNISEPNPQLLPEKVNRSDEGMNSDSLPMVTSDSLPITDTNNNPKKTDENITTEKGIIIIDPAEYDIVDNAEKEKQAAYIKYTRIATGEENGDIEAALKDYKEKYYKWKSLKEKMEGKTKE